MDVEDYIRIRGNDWDAAPFQGIGGGECAGTPNVEPGEVIEPVMTAIDAGLWQAQTATISGERVYLAALNQQFRDTQAFLEDGAFKDGLMLLKEIGEEALSQRLTAYLLKTAAASLGATGAALIALLVPAIIDFGISKAIDWLADYLKEGNKLIDALMS